MTFVALPRSRSVFLIHNGEFNSFLKLRHTFIFAIYNIRIRIAYEEFLIYIKIKEIPFLLLYIMIIMCVFLHVRVDIYIVILLACFATTSAVRWRKYWSIFSFIIILKKSTRSKIRDTIIFSFLLAFHWSSEWKVIIEHKRSPTLSSQR